MVEILVVMKRDTVLIRLNSSTAEYSAGASGARGSRIVSALSRIRKMSTDERNGRRAVKPEAFSGFAPVTFERRLMK